MNASAVAAPPADPDTLVVGYEVLRAAFLASRASPATRSSIQRLVSGGLYAWLRSASLLPLPKVRRASAADSPPITTAVAGSDDFIQLVASMTIQSLVYIEQAA